MTFPPRDEKAFECGNCGLNMPAAVRFITCANLKHTILVCINCKKQDINLTVYKSRPLHSHLTDFSQKLDFDGGTFESVYWLHRRRFFHSS